MRKAMVVLFALAMVFAMSNTGNAQIVSTGSEQFTVDVLNGLTIAMSGGDMTQLVAGYTYTLNPDVNAAFHVSPFISGAEDGNPLNINVATSPGVSFELTLDLPTSLAGSVNSLSCSFNANSMIRTEDGALYNPNVPNVISTGLAGTADLWLGITVTVPKYALDGDAYVGTVVATANAVGL